MLIFLPVLELPKLCQAPEAQNERLRVQQRISELGLISEHAKEIQKKQYLELAAFHFARKVILNRVIQQLDPSSCLA